MDRRSEDGVETPDRQRALTSDRRDIPAERLKRLVEAGLLLTSELSLEGVLQRVADIACELMEARYAAIGVIAEDGHTLSKFITSGISPELRKRIGALPSGRGILGLVIREKRPIRLADLSSHPDSYGFPAHHPPMKSFLGVPITGRRGVFGNLYLAERAGGEPFTEEDEETALMLAAQAGAALENARLHEETTRLLEEVQQLHRSREVFFATVNHELRNAIAGVFGWAEMLVRKREPETVPRAAYEVLEAAEQAITLINDLLDLSRLDENRLKPNFQEVEVAFVVARSVRLVTPSAEGKDVTIEISVPKDVPTCRTDSNRVEQILVNLLGNAIRHSPSPATVWLRTSARNGFVRFVVEDHGQGIAEEDLDRIFDIYFTKTGDGGAGTGLGLPLSRRLARLLGGELEAENRPEGGARLVLELPQAVSQGKE